MINSGILSEFNEGYFNVPDYVNSVVLGMQLSCFLKFVILRVGN